MAGRRVSVDQTRSEQRFLSLKGVRLLYWNCPRYEEKRMTTESVRYSLQNQVATIRIDDGKRNALSPEVLREIYQALDRAESDRATVILTGRESVFSAGFDLHVMKRGGINALRMLRAGYALTV